jgi:CHAT domain-containing protein
MNKLMKVYYFLRRILMWKTCLLATMIVAIVSVVQAECYQIKSFSEILIEGNIKYHIERCEKYAPKLEKAGKFMFAAIAYLRAGQLYNYTGNYEAGLASGLKAASLAEKSNSPITQAWSIHTYATSYLWLGQYDKAVKSLEDALIIARKAEPNYYTNLLISTIYRYLSYIHVRRGNYDKALLYAKSSIGLYEGQEDYLLSTTLNGKDSYSNKLGMRRAYVGALITAGAISLMLNNFDAAITVLEKADRFAAGLIDWQIYRLSLLAIAYGKTGNTARALELNKEACLKADEANVPSLSYAAHGGFAWTLRLPNRHEEAIPHSYTAIKQVEDERSLMRSEDNRMSYLERNLDVYNGLIKSLVITAKTDEAFNIAEHVRARAFLEVLGTRVDLSRGKASGLIKKEQELKNRIISLQDGIANLSDPLVDIHNLTNSKQPNKDDIDQLKKDLAAAMDGYHLLIQRIKEEAPETASLLTVSPLTLKEVQKLLAPDQSMLVYYVMPDQLLVWCITNSEASFKTVQIKQEDLVKKIQGYRSAIAMRADLDIVDELGAQLYEKLIPDKILMVSQGKMKLIIVPHGMLHYMPFQALRTDDEHYLVEKKIISYLSSASLFKFINKRNNKDLDNLLAFGNPDVNDSSLNLAFAEKEVNKIGSQFKNAEVYTGKEATKKRAIDESQKYHILHFATHGELNERQPLESSLRLASASNQDGRLTAREIFRMSIESSLVVLSACETALGKISSGDELISINRAFLYAGASSVVSTLWKVSDESTYLFMDDFYKNMKSQSLGEALRTSQLNLRNKYPHPFFWSPFILSGATN